MQTRALLIAGNPATIGEVRSSLPGVNVLSVRNIATAHSQYGHAYPGFDFVIIDADTCGTRLTAEEDEFYTLGFDGKIITISQVPGNNFQLKKNAINAAIQSIAGA